MSNNTLLFACSKCFTKHPFEELSSGQQLCKDCRGTFPIVKCTYCRSEFQQTNKLSTNTICSKCESNVKQFGKPSACEYCNIIAAFIGNKCQRCTNSERKYGAPVTCEQCKQKCAFDRKDDDKKIQVDGKLLCWLCTLSYKRALAKTKQNEADRRAQMKLGSSQRPNKSGRENRSNRSSGTKRSSTQRSDVAKLEIGLEVLPPVAKAMRTNRPPGDLIDPNSSDHVVAMTQLKEQMASLQKQITQKDAQLLAKDKQICELKAKHFTNETELRGRMQSSERDFEKKVEFLNSKIKGLQKEVATLSKSTKANRSAKNSLSNETNNALSSGAGSGGSGTDSPLP